MSDTELNTDPVETAASPAIIRVPIPKGGKDAFIAVNLAEIQDDADYQLIIVEGLKAILNARMSKVGAVTKLEGKELDEAHAKAMTIAQENLEALKTGKLRTKAKRGAAKSDVPREVMTEAMKNARNMVKDLIREAKGYPSQYAASEITAMAKKLIEADPSILADAHKAIDARKSKESRVAIDILAIGKPDPKRVAKANEAAAKKRERTLSAASAGKTAKHAPPPPRKSRGDAPHITH